MQEKNVHILNYKPEGTITEQTPVKDTIVKQNNVKDDIEPRDE